VTHRRIEMVHIVSTTLSNLLVPVLVKDSHIRVTTNTCTGQVSTRSFSFHSREDILGVQHARIQFGGSLVILTDQKDFRRLGTTGLGFKGLHLTKQLLEEPRKGSVIATSVNLGNKGSTPHQMLRGTLEGVQGNFVLLVSVLTVISTDVGSTIVQDHLAGIFS
jgi:hypothetical protein